MISERKLASSHSSFWRVVLPMGDAFIRTMNVRLKRLGPARAMLFDSSRVGLISELSFRIYEDAVARGAGVRMTGNSDGLVEQQRLEALKSKVAEYIATLERKPLIPIEDTEADEALVWAARMESYLEQIEGRVPVLVRPKFRGCGILNSCEGDLLIGTTLYEIKNVERDFRQADVRQLLCYCALNSVSSTYRIDRVALLNARNGTHTVWYLNALCLAAAGMPASTLLSEIINYVNVDRPSK